MKTISFLLFVAVVVTGCGDAVAPPESPAFRKDYIVFGRYYGECLGKQCHEIFKIEGGELFEDTLDYYPSQLYSGAYARLGDARHNAVKELKSYIPDSVFTVPDGRIGEPDAHDQGGVYLELVKDGYRHYWLIDTDKPRIPIFLHAVIDSIRIAVDRLQ